MYVEHLHWNKPRSLLKQTRLWLWDLDTDLLRVKWYIGSRKIRHQRQPSNFLKWKIPCTVHYEGDLIKLKLQRRCYTSRRERNQTDSRVELRLESCNGAKSGFAISPNSAHPQKSSNPTHQSWEMSIHTFSFLHVSSLSDYCLSSQSRSFPNKLKPSYVGMLAHSQAILCTTTEGWLRSRGFDQ